MSPDSDNDSSPEHENIEDVLKKQRELEEVLKNKFMKEMTIVFSDVSGYTKFMDTYGDIRGRAWIQKHHDIVFPIIESHGGEILSIMGDGLMISFEDTPAAVLCAMDAQKALDDYNAESSESDHLHIHVGINHGRILVDKDHIAGDVVNTASRIQSQAVADQILISRNVYSRISDNEDILCRFHNKIEVKGKAEALELYRVIWRAEDAEVGAQAVVDLGGKSVRSYPGTAPAKVLQLDITRDGERLKISADEQDAGGSSTVKHYEELPVSMDKIEARCREVVETLNKTNRKGFITRDIFTKFRDIGQVFSDDLFTQRVKEKIRQTTADHLIVNLDDHLVQIPWELLHDGREFLCQRFAMGRVVRTRQNVVENSTARTLAHPLKMLVMADPKGDLKGAYQEGTQIRDFIDSSGDLINGSLRSENITPDFIKEKIRNFDFVHFAGHADYDIENPQKSGWRLSSGNLSAEDIMKMAGAGAMPALIFSNACQSARTEEWSIKQNFHEEIFGLANAFVLSGVKHYVGTFWEVLDDPSSRFALEFYKQVVSGSTIGESVRQSRLALIEEYGEETIVWGSYLLYGDPTFNYIGSLQAGQAEPGESRPPRTELQHPEKKVRAQSDVIDFGDRGEKKKSPLAWVALVAAVVIIALGFWGYSTFLKEDTQKFQQAALSLYQAGDYPEALKACDTLESKDADLRLPYLIRGNIALRNGDLEKAATQYNRALTATKGSNNDEAETLVGLGRIASLKKQADKALDYYQQASQAAPQSGQAYLGQAFLLEQSGKYDDALKLMSRAGKIAPDDRALAAFTRETRKKAALNQDQEKRAKIDKLVSELLESMQSPPRALPTDGWTSQPLTLWIMDFQTRGYSLGEGEDRLLGSGLTEALIDKSRIQVVERALFDKLLEELKLGSSKLMDQRTALSLGKLMAARLILSGKITYSGPQTLVSLRLIETETGRVTAALNEIFPGSGQATLLTDKLSRSLIDKINKKYTLKGKIEKITGDDILINIGSRIGVTEGIRFQETRSGVVLEVIATQSETSLVSVVSGEGQPVEGLRVKQIE